jgi:hypothetical protein
MIITHLLNQRATIYTQAIDKFGDHILTNPLEVSCRFRFITELDRQQNQELVGSTAMFWFEPDTEITDGSIIKGEDLYWRISKLTKARRVTEEVDFLKVFVDKYDYTVPDVPPPPLLPAPVALEVTDITFNSGIFHWEAVEGAESYVPEYSDTPQFINGGTQPTTDLFTLWSGLDPNFTFYTRVKAVNSEGESDWSNVISFTTLENIIVIPEFNNDYPVNGTGNATFDIGYFGRAFDGNSGEIDFGQHYNFNGEQPFSFSFVFKMKPEATGQVFLFGNMPNELHEDKGWRVFTVNEGYVKLYFEISNGGGYGNSIQVQTNGSHQPDTWYRAVITYDGSKTSVGTKLYINALLSSNNPDIDNLTASSRTDANFRVGQGPFLLDDLAIYNRVLTVDEINVIDSISVFDSAIFGTPNLIGYWRFEDVITDSRQDFSNTGQFTVQSIMNLGDRYRVVWNYNTFNPAIGGEFIAVGINQTIPETSGLGYTVTGSVVQNFSIVELDYSFIPNVDVTVDFAAQQSAGRRDWTSNVVHVSEYANYSNEPTSGLVGDIVSPLYSYQALENYLCMSRFIASQSGVGNVIKLIGNGAGNVRVAVYADTNGVATTILGQGLNAIVQGENVIEITDITLEEGKVYWIAVNQDTYGIVGFKEDVDTEGFFYKASNFSENLVDNPDWTGWQTSVNKLLVSVDYVPDLTPFAIDKTANGNDLINRNGVVISTEVPAGTNITRSAEFHRELEQTLEIEDANQTGLDFDKTFTLELWTKHLNYEFFQWYINKGLSYDMHFRPTGNTNRKTANHVYGPEGLDGFSNIYGQNDGEWHHVAMTCNVDNPSGTTFEFFLDGVFTGNGTAEDAIDNISSITNTNLPFIIGGGYASETTRHALMDGYLADIRVWNTVRSHSEIADNYQTKLTGNEAGLVAYYNFEEETPPPVEEGFPLTRFTKSIGQFNIENLANWNQIDGQVRVMVPDNPTTIGELYAGPATQLVFTDYPEVTSEYIQSTDFSNLTIDDTHIFLEIDSSYPDFTYHRSFVTTLEAIQPIPFAVANTVNLHPLPFEGGGTDLGIVFDFVSTSSERINIVLGIVPQLGLRFYGSASPSRVIQVYEPNFGGYTSWPEPRIYYEPGNWRAEYHRNTNSIYIWFNGVFWGEWVYQSNQIENSYVSLDPPQAGVIITNARGYELVAFTLGVEVNPTSVTSLDEDITITETKPLEPNYNATLFNPNGVVIDQVTTSDPHSLNWFKTDGGTSVDLINGTYKIALLEENQIVNFLWDGTSNDYANIVGDIGAETTLEVNV